MLTAYPGMWGKVHIFRFGQQPEKIPYSDVNSSLYRSLAFSK